MYLDFNAEQQALRKEIRNYYKSLLTPELRRALNEEREQMGGPVYRHIVGRMGAAGWLGIGWPKEYGGQGTHAPPRAVRPAIFRWPRRWPSCRVR